MRGTFYVLFELSKGLSRFGPRGSGWARISVATADEALDLGLARLAAAL